MAGRRVTEHGRRLQLVVLVALIAASCGAESPPLPTSPPAPAGWTTVVAGDVALVLPPWLVPFDTTGAIFANEVVEPGSQGVELMAEGPRGAEPQPVAGESLERWLLRRIDSPVAGVPTVRQVDLPAGGAVVVERLDEDGPTYRWRFAAYAIHTPRGVAFLLIDGPPDAWVGREAELAQIPWLLQVGR